MHHSRRHFLKRATAATALGVVGSSALRARLLQAQPEHALLELGYRAVDESELRALAQRALDAAKSAGAVFADVRVNTGKVMGVGFYDGEVTSPDMGWQGSVGVRALVDGAWGFASEGTMSPDGVARLAKLAVGRAKAGRRRERVSFELAPAPVVPEGRWETPIEIDPFTIPQGEMEQFFIDAASDLKNLKGLGGYQCRVDWLKGEGIFASTDGSVIWQRIHHAGVSTAAWVPSKYVPTIRIFQVPQTLRNGGQGYEIMARSNLKTEWRKSAEEAMRIATLPIKSAEVGRFDVVLAANSAAQYVASTVAESLRMDRAMGDVANSWGTTFAMPPADIVGKYRMASPLLTVTADRSRPKAMTTVGWDDEGVKPEDFTLVQDGIVVDYLTTREYAPVLTSWYKQQRKTVRSHGCAVGRGLVQPSLALPNLSIMPAAAPVSLNDLIRDVKRGYYVIGDYVSRDQQVMNIQSGGLESSLVYEITNGKLGGLVKNYSTQFTTTQFWKNLDGLGGAESASLNHLFAGPFDADTLSHIGVYSVPIRVRQVNVVNIGKQA